MNALTNVPNFKFITYTKEGRRVDQHTHDYMSGKKVALIFVPGAYTPTCNKHIQEFAEKVKQATIMIVVPNDCDVANSWRQNVLKDNDYKLILVADPELKFTTACEPLLADERVKLTFVPDEERGLGSKRPARLAMIVDNLKMQQYMFDLKKVDEQKCKIVENASYNSTNADTILKLLND